MSGGNGKTCGRSMKGQKARGGVRPCFEGGQFPFYRRIPKYGRNPEKENFVVLKSSVVNSLLERINGREEKEFVFSLELLKKEKLVGIKESHVKILFDVPLDHKIDCKDKRIKFSLINFKN